MDGLDPGVVSRVGRLVAVVLLVVAAMGLPAEAGAAPGDCNQGAVTQPVGLPFGTSFWLHNDFAGTHNSSAPSTIGYTDGANHTTGILGVGPVNCVLNGLSFNSADGYLYAFEDPEVQGSPLVTSSPLVKIGKDSAGNMAMVEVATQPTIPAAVGPAPNDIEGFLAAMDASGQLTTAGLYVNLANLQDPDQLAPSILNFQPNGAFVGAVPETFSASCVPYLQNLMGQYAIYFQSLAWNAANPLLPRWDQVAPEGGLQDWAYSPIDGQLYGYAAVDLRDSAYPRTGGPIPGATQSYLGKSTIIPNASWLPPGVAGPYTLVRQPDWVLKINPTTGSTDCAQVAGPSGFQSGAIALPTSPSQPTSRDPRDDSSFEPLYGPGGQTTTILGGGGSEIAGTSFSTNGHMQLFESEESRHWDFDPSTCAFNPAAAATCQAPTLVAGDVLPGGRQRGDAASAIFPATVPITITKVIEGTGSGDFDIGATTTNGAASSTARVSLGGGQSASVSVTTSNGVIVVNEVQQAGWSLESATCGAAGEVVAPAAGTVTFTITPGQQIACRFTNVLSVTGPNSVTTTTTANTTTSTATTTSGPMTATSVTSTTAGGADPEAITPTTPPAPLAFTGGGLSGLTPGLGLLAAGTAVLAARRRRSAPSAGRRRD